MKKYYRIMAAVTMVFVIVLAAANVYIWNMNIQDENRIHKVSVNRIRQEIFRYETQNHGAPGNLDELERFVGTGHYEGIAGLEMLPVQKADTGQLQVFFGDEPSDYAVACSEYAYYKIIYDTVDENKDVFFWIINVVGVLFWVISLAVMWYLYIHIVKPFERISMMPYDLAKGNLSMPLKAQRSGYLKHFIWGMDMLREKLEQQKIRELELHKEKKLLLLSLSHDIKTPLSALKLYAQALGRNLYGSSEKQHDIAIRMNAKVDEMETYIADIIQTSREDLLEFDVHVKEIYVKEVLEYIREYYGDKMKLNQITFEMGKYQNCLVLADGERLIEVLQNILENALKYGDGRYISMRMESGDEEFLIYVENTGCTMEKKELAHIYDSFYRGSNVGKQAGSGLGLYICRELMLSMDGEIMAHINESDGERLMEMCIAVRMAG